MARELLAVGVGEKRARATDENDLVVRVDEELAIVVATPDLPLVVLGAEGARATTASLVPPPNSSSGSAICVIPPKNSPPSDATLRLGSAML
jgi:hypothetical protein